MILTILTFTIQTSYRNNSFEKIGFLLYIAINFYSMLINFLYFISVIFLMLIHINNSNQIDVSARVQRIERVIMVLQDLTHKFFVGLTLIFYFWSNIPLKNCFIGACLIKNDHKYYLQIIPNKTEEILILSCLVVVAFLILSEKNLNILNFYSNYLKLNEEEKHEDAKINNLNNEENKNFQRNNSNCNNQAKDMQQNKKQIEGKSQENGKNDSIYVYHNMSNGNEYNNTNNKTLSNYQTNIGENDKLIEEKRESLIQDQAETLIITDNFNKGLKENIIFPQISNFHLKIGKCIENENFKNDVKENKICSRISNSSFLDDLKKIIVYEILYFLYTVIDTSIKYFKITKIIDYRYDDYCSIHDYNLIIKSIILFLFLGINRRNLNQWKQAFSGEVEIDDESVEKNVRDILEIKTDLLNKYINRKVL